MKWPPCASKISLGRILTVLIVLGTLKLGVLGAWSLLTLDLTVQPPAGNPEVEAQAGSGPRASQPRVKVSVSRAQAADAETRAAEKEVARAGSLSEQWEKLNHKEQELRRREKSLHELEQELDKKLARQEELKNRLEEIIQEARVLKDNKIKHLVDVYSNMQPEQAAKVLETLDQSIAVKILAGMRGRTAGEILSFVQAEKAASLSEDLTDFQTPFEE